MYNNIQRGVIMKKYVMGLLTGIVIMISIGVFAEYEIQVYPNKYSIIVRGQQTNIKAYIIDNRAYLQLKDTSEALGVPTTFNAELQQIEIDTAKGNEGDQMEQASFKNIKSNNYKFNSGHIIRIENEYYLELVIFAVYLETINGEKISDNNYSVVGYKISIPGKNELVFNKLNKEGISDDKNIIRKYSRTYVMISALGLTVTEDGDTLWIE